MLSVKMQKELMRHYLCDVMGRCDHGTYEHSLRVGKLCQGIAEELELQRPESSFVAMAGLLHDVGKIFMTEVINYPGELAGKQRDMISYHPQFGTRFLNIHWNKLPNLVTEGIVLHHERLDGKGYPFNLEDAEIPLVARIVAVADVYDAMSQSRPYRLALEQQAIEEELKGPGYDQAIVQALFDYISHHRAIYSEHNLKWVYNSVGG